MEIKLAKTAGFCFGVNRAVEMVYKLLDEGKNVCTLGPIIHNPQLVDELKSKGVKIIESPEQAGPDEIVVIRSHGVPEKTLNTARERGIEIADATCPYVKKIHRVVSEASREGRVVLIAGDPLHSEVIGIRGHCNGESYVFSDESSLYDFIEQHPELQNMPITVVAQTTFNAQLWQNCQKILKKVYTNAVIFDTICNATSIRQEEAEQLAKQCDMMIIVGGKHSSNTAKLKEVCERYCGRCIHVETAAELRDVDFSGIQTVGVVAGASTPAGIIKEVLNTMSENLKPVDETNVIEGAADANTVSEANAEKSFDEMSFEEALEASLNSLNTDQIVRGVVVSVNPSEIQVDIGRKQTGIIPANEFSADSNVDLLKSVKPGDEFNLIVLKVNDQEGTVLLSKRRYDAVEGWKKIVAAKENKEILQGTVSDIVNGGVIVVCDNVRVFVPASLATLNKNEDLQQLKGKQVPFRVIETGRKRRVIGSIRSVLIEEKKAKEAQIWETIEVGKRYTGVVKSLTNYGAFVDLGGVDGMIHISELAWNRIKHPSEVVNVGDVVEVVVKDVDKENKRISLSYKKTEDNPWEILKREYPVGSVVRVKIVNLTSYGAFARIIPGIDGLIHISQIANRRIEKPQDELSVGQEVDAKIINIDFENKRVSLSIRALLEEKENADNPPESQEGAAVEAGEQEPSAEPETMASDGAEVTQE
ncbi:MAG TPA: bifunctional 4-hydroxy-3-methylbut-2-enyl diphosphate reductase/30S ribosomal protein S1 [Clostridiales bacterium]|nr:bifunctional 4-hydroxy-3-methylbut-2-enyl diphosphate reductase/30S ribosomal protein S1 [Clostridiales bacterium]